MQTVCAAIRQEGGRSVTDFLDHTLPPEETVLLQEHKGEDLLYRLADLYKIFGDSTRLRILFALSEGELKVVEIAGKLGMSMSAISHQLRVLKQAHLVKFRREGKNAVYSLADDHVSTILAQGMEHICE